MRTTSVQPIHELTHRYGYLLARPQWGRPPDGGGRADQLCLVPLPGLQYSPMRLAAITLCIGSLLEPDGSVRRLIRAFSGPACCPDSQSGLQQVFDPDDQSSRDSVAMSTRACRAAAMRHPGMHYAGLAGACTVLQHSTCLCLCIGVPLSSSVPVRLRRWRWPVRWQGPQLLWLPQVQHYRLSTPHELILCGTDHLGAWCLPPGWLCRLRR